MWVILVTRRNSNFPDVIGSFDHGLDAAGYLIADGWKTIVKGEESMIWAKKGSDRVATVREVTRPS
jgi:hypothetical protein